MRIISAKTLNESCKEHKTAKTAIEDWVVKTRAATWKNAADVKATFSSVDSVGNKRYVFNRNDSN